MGTPPLAGLQVTLTGFGQSIRDQVSTALTALGGVFLSELVHGQTTHLVANKVGTAKYQAAVDAGIPIVKYEFIRACLDQRHIVDFSAYLLGPFSGLSITISRIHGQERMDMIHVIEEGGGTYRGEMVLGTVTHLVVREPWGDKYLYALTWNLHIVSPDWIKACMELGAWQPESSFPVLQPPSLSIVPISNDDDEHESAPPQFEQTMPPQDVAEEEFRLALESFSPMGSPCHRALRGCVLFLEGVEDEDLKRKLSWLATLCDAVVVWDMFQDVSHVVVGPHTFERAAAIHKEFPTVMFVKYTWLIECNRRQKRAPARLFAWELPSESRPQSQLATKRPRLDSSTFSDIACSLQGMVVCVSRYVDAERTEVEQLVKYLGGVFTERLTKENPAVNVLVCKDELGPKYQAAVEWKIKLIRDIEWLRRCALAKRDGLR